MGDSRPDPSGGGGREGGTLEELFLALEGPLLGYALRFARNREMAEDLVQEAFLRLHEHRETVREPRSWLYRTVHNLALNQLRAGARVVPLSGPVPLSDPGADAAMEEDPADGAPLPDEQLARWEGIGLVRLGMQALDARSREVVLLKFHENLSYQEIGARTGLTPGHVGYVLHHAVKALAVELSKAGLLR